MTSEEAKKAVGRTSMEIWGSLGRLYRLAKEINGSLTEPSTLKMATSHDGVEVLRPLANDLKARFAAYDEAVALHKKLFNEEEDKKVEAEWAKTVAKQDDFVEKYSRTMPGEGKTAYVCCYICEGRQELEDHTVDTGHTHKICKYCKRMLMIKHEIDHWLYQAKAKRDKRHWPADDYTMNSILSNIEGIVAGELEEPIPDED